MFLPPGEAPPTEALKHHITPLSFELPDRKVKIKEIRRHVTQQVGPYKLFHAQKSGPAHKFFQVFFQNRPYWLETVILG